MDSSVPLTHHDPKIDLFRKETQNLFSDSFGVKNSILDFLKETRPKKLSIRTLRVTLAKILR